MRATKGINVYLADEWVTIMMIRKACVYSFCVCPDENDRLDSPLGFSDASGAELIHFTQIIHARFR